jgi:hypothetical protein
MPRTDLKATVLAILLFAATVGVFTIVSLFVSPPGSQTGQLRAISAIPDHLALLVVGGVVLGSLPSIIYRRLDLALLVSIPIFVVLVDLDHLPIALGIAQPVRPAHSIIFIATVFVLMTTIIKRLDLSFAAMSGFFAHVGIDSGVFAPWAPLSFDYYDLTDYRWIFVSLAVASVVVSGYFAKRKSVGVESRN